MGTAPDSERLLSIIELQNAIIAAGLNSDEVMSLVVERACTLTNASGSVVALTEGEEVVTRAASGTSRTTVGNRVAAAAKARAANDDHALAVPLLYGESAIGFVEVTASKGAPLAADAAETLRLLAQIIAIALHRAYTYPKPRRDVDHDPLTGLGNRRAYEDRIDAELARNRRYGHSFSLALLELGNLETAIDRLGQAAGDEGLIEIATILKKHTRAIDGCFRIAADEVAIVLPGTTHDGAKILVERCRAHIKEARPLEGAITPSFGVIEAVAAETKEQISERVNAALNADKQRA